MPIACHVNHEQRLVVATLSGVVTEGDIFGYQKEVWSRPDTQKYDELIDMTEVAKIESVTSERVASLADFSTRMDPAAPTSRLAIIATNDLHFGLARMYQNRREIASRGAKVVRVFRNRPEAMDWLGGGAKPPPPIE